MKPGTSISAREGLTERLGAVALLGGAARGLIARGPLPPGRYLEVQGPGEPAVIALGGEITHLGRGLAADVRLDDASVSRRHAVIVPLSTGARILDDRSSNGTLVNGRRVQQADLRDGDTIALGRVTLRYVEV